MKVNSRRTRGCATSQTTLLAVALLTFMGAGALWSVSGKSSSKRQSTPQAIPVKAPAPKRSDRAPMMARVDAASGEVASGKAATVRPAPSARALAGRAKLPLAFEPNQGQASAPVSYLARGAGYGLYLTPQQAILSLGGASAHSGTQGTPRADVRMSLEGVSSDVKIEAADPLPGKTNYFRGNDPSRWVRNVPTFARVQYAAVYPGIDLVYYGKQGQLEYDFDVRAGANPNQIRLGLSGVDSVVVSADGGLQLSTQGREIRWNKPVIYQEVNGRRRPVEGRFQLLAENRVGFALGVYDRSRDLVIDPILAYASYFGGSGAEMNPQVAVDLSASIYIAGTTTSTGTTFPTEPCGGTLPPQPVCPKLNGTDTGTSSDVFVSKLDQFGSTVLYTTYLNGEDLVPSVGLGLATGDDSSAGLAVDSQGNVYITGTTTSTDFPTTSNAFQSAPKTPGVAHVFLTKLDSTGAGLLYSSYLSGSNADNAMALAADNTGHAYILGWTQSVTAGDFPTGTSFQPSANGATRLYFVSKFDTTTTVANQSLVFFSYLGDSTNPAKEADGVVCAQLPCGGIALDTNGNAFVAVGTKFTNLPAVNSYQSTNHGGASDAYEAKITPDGASILFATYLGGSGDDTANAIAVDGSGNTYIAGSTTSSDFPAGTTKLPMSGGGQDAFLAKLNDPTTGPVTLTYTAVVGGSGTDIANGIIVDSAANALITGSTNSSNFPTPTATIGSNGGSTDAFLLKLATGSSALTTFVSSQLLGGTGTDRPTGVALSPNGGAVVVGETNSSDFPTQSQYVGVTPLRTALSGPSDAFLANFGPQTDLMITVLPSPNPVAVGSATTFTYTISNLGPDASTGAVVTIPIPVSNLGVTLGAVTASSGACVATGTTNNQVETCLLGTILANSNASVTVKLTPTTIAPANNVPPTVTMKGSVAAGSTAVDKVASNNSTSTTATVDYFTSAVAPPSFSVVAGNTATYTVTITPHGGGSAPAQFPATVTLGCALPTTPVALAGASCTFTPTPIPAIAVGAGSATSVLKITTTRPTQTGELRGPARFFYALWLPLCGLAIFGASSRRRRRWISGVAILVLLGTLSWLPACSKSNPVSTNGTQPGTYSIGITSTSGSYVYPPTTSPLTVSLTVTAP